MDKRQLAVVAAIKEAEQGVDYTPKHGASCPFCGKRARVLFTRGWTGNVRIRYHRCPNRRCPINSLERSIKSIESGR
jgi:hypothetical protein